jgi:hypothetical protein
MHSLLKQYLRGRIDGSQREAVLLGKRHCRPRRLDALRDVKRQGTL